MTHKLFKGLASFALSLSMVGGALPVMAQESDGWKYLNTVESNSSSWEGETVTYKMYPCGWHDEDYAKSVDPKRVSPAQTHFQASPSASLEVSAKNDTFSGIVIGWTHYYDGEVTGEFGKQTGVLFDKENLDYDFLHKYETGEIHLEKNLWGGYVLDGWSTSLEGNEIITNNTLPFKPGDSGEHKLYLHWHKADNKDINQATWVKYYEKSLYYQVSMSKTEYEACLGQKLEISANITPNSNNFDSLTWTATGGASVERGYRKAYITIPKNAPDTITVTAELADDPLGDRQNLSSIIPDGVQRKVGATIHVHQKHEEQKTPYYSPSGSYYKITCSICGAYLGQETIPPRSGGSVSGGGVTPPAQKEEPKEPEQNDEQKPEEDNKEPEPQETPKEPEPAPSQPEPDTHQVDTQLQDEIQLSDKQVETKTEIVEDKEVTKTTFEDLHEETKVESEKAVSNYVETVDHTFAGAQVEVKESAAPAETVQVEMKAIPVSTQASQPIVLNASNDTKVSLPVENANWGTVALLVDEDGKTYSIDSSYYDGNGNIVIPVNKNMKVVLQNRALEFADVTGDINSYPANNIAFLSARGIMTGKGDGTNFDPEGNLTRGQLALMLYRKAGEPAGYNNSSLPEGVAAESYYANAARWAAGTGLMAQGGSAFNGDKAITREQMALILYRQSGTNTVQTASLSNYSDAGFISSDDAKNAIAWNVEHNIMGNGTTSLNPQENTKRQDVAAMIARYIQPEIAKVQ